MTCVRRFHHASMLLAALLVVIFTVVPPNLVGAEPVSSWTSVDIGTSTAGSTTESGYTLSVSGSGAGIAGTSDSFRFVYDSAAAANLELQVKITSWNGGNSQTAKAGLMMRSNTTPGAAFALVTLTSRKGIRFQWRAAERGKTVESAGPSSFQLPIWLKLKKAGGAFTAFYASDGVTWKQIGSSASASLPSSYLLGMAVTSAREGTRASAVFENLQGPAPVISSLDPSSGPERAQFSLYGEYLTGVTDVYIGQYAAYFSPVSPYQIYVDVPDGAIDGPVSVTSPYGYAVSPAPFHVLYPPVIADFSPYAGPVGTIVSISGRNFQRSPIQSVTVFNIPAQYSVVSDTLIRLVVPQGASYGPIRIDSVDGTASTGSFEVTSLPNPPVITGMSPTSGEPGATVTLHGAFLSQTSQVAFPGGQAAFTVIDDATLQATVPQTARTGLVTVTTPGGTASTPFTVILPPGWPSITSTTPVSGENTAFVHIFGTGFTNLQSVLFSGANGPIPAMWAYPISDTEIETTVPFGAVSGPVTVQTSVGSAATSFDFRILDWHGMVINAMTKGDFMVESGKLFVHAGGVGYGGTADSFYYTSDLFTNDYLEMRGRIVSTDCASLPDCQAGYMIRASVDADAAFAAVYVDKARAIHFSYRLSAGAPVTNAVAPDLAPDGPFYVSLFKMGNTISAGYSLNDGGVYLNFGNAANISLPATYHAGPATSSTVDGQVVSAEYDFITAEEPQIGFFGR